MQKRGVESFIGIGMQQRGVERQGEELKKEHKKEGPQRKQKEEGGKILKERYSKEKERNERKCIFFFSNILQDL